MYFFFFFKQKTAYEMRISDWSSDVCSSDLSWPLAEELLPDHVGDRALRGRTDDPRHRTGEARPGLDRYADRAGRTHPVRRHLQRSQRPGDTVHHGDPDDAADGRPRRAARTAPRVLVGGGAHPAVRRLPARFARCLPRGRSEEHTSELQSLMRISYAVFCLK